MSIGIDINLHAKQGEALQALASPQITYLGYGGARGGGKSHFSRAYLILRSLKYKGSKHLLIRRTFAELQRNHIDNLIKEYGAIGHYNAGKHYFILNNGSIIELGYCEKDSDLERYQGGEYDTIVVDECQFQTEKRFEYFKGCLRSTSKDLKPKMLATFNPGGVGHTFLKRIFVDKTIDDKDDINKYEFVRALVYDNPTIVDNDPDYVKRLESLPEPIRSAWLNGDFGVFEGQFYSISSKSLVAPFHIEESTCRECLYGSLDHGISHNTSFGLWYLDRINRKFYRLFSYIASGNTAEDHAREIYDRIQTFQFTHGVFPRVIWADPSMWTATRLSERYTRSTIDEYKDVFARNGNVIFEKANNSKVTGCTLMRESLSEKDGQPQLYYFDKYNTQWVEQVQYVETDPNNRDICLKMDGDDAADETRYGIVGLSSVLVSEAQSKVHNKIISNIRSQIAQKSWMDL